MGRGCRTESGHVPPDFVSVWRQPGGPSPGLAVGPLCGEPGVHRKQINGCQRLHGGTLDVSGVFFWVKERFWNWIKAVIA